MPKILTRDEVSSSANKKSKGAEYYNYGTVDIMYVATVSRIIEIISKSKIAKYFHTIHDIFIASCLHKGWALTQSRIIIRCALTLLWKLTRRLARRRQYFYPSRIQKLRLTDQTRASQIMPILIYKSNECKLYNSTLYRHYEMNNEHRTTVQEYCKTARGTGHLQSVLNLFTVQIAVGTVSQYHVTIASALRTPTA